LATYIFRCFDIPPAGARAAPVAELTAAPAGTCAALAAAPHTVPLIGKNLQFGCMLNSRFLDEPDGERSDESVDARIYQYVLSAMALYVSY
jgi:hypothetical protein